MSGTYKRAGRVSSLVGCASGRIPRDAEMVKPVLARANPGPDSHAEVAGVGCAGAGVGDLRSVAVPYGVACVDWCALGHAALDALADAVGNESEVPHADDRLAVAGVEVVVAHAA